ncbi:Spatzle-Processing Enzyme [Carabus blaptoides fortunei]
MAFFARNILAQTISNCNDKSTVMYRNPGYRQLCGESNSDRIIGGIDANIGQFPWLARLGYANLKFDPNNIEYNCGGSLITECWVLSAAHCVTELSDSVYMAAIRLGEHNTHTPVDCSYSVCADLTQDFRPSRILIPQSYGKSPYRHDISLIKLHKPARITRWVQPICLPVGDLLKKHYIGARAEVAGWGLVNSQNDMYVPILQTVRLPILPNQICTEAFKNKVKVDQMQMCIGGEIGYDSCGGDSGGPLMKVDVVTYPKYYIVGIVSFGIKDCGRREVPAVYTRVAKYMKWILDNLTAC